MGIGGGNGVVGPSALGWGTGRAILEAGDFGMAGMDRGGQVAGDGNMGPLLALKGADQRGQGVDFDHEGHEVAVLRMNTYGDWNFQGDKIDFGVIDLEVLVVANAIMMEVMVHVVGGGLMMGVAVTRGVTESGLGLVLRRAEVPKGEHLGGAVELKDALSLRRKMEEVPALQSGLMTDELAIEEAPSWEPLVGCLRRQAGSGTGSHGERGRSFLKRGCLYGEALGRRERRLWVH